MTSALRGQSARQGAARGRRQVVPPPPSPPPRTQAPANANTGQAARQARQAGRQSVGQEEGIEQQSHNHRQHARRPLFTSDGVYSEASKNAIAIEGCDLMEVLGDLRRSFPLQHVVGAVSSVTDSRDFLVVIHSPPAATLTGRAPSIRT